MKKAPYLILLLLLVLTGCSKEEQEITNEASFEYENVELDEVRSPSLRVSITGNQDFSLIAMRQSNGNIIGHWRDNQQGGLFVKVDCIMEFESNFGIGVLISGLVNRGPQKGSRYFTFVYDENPFDGLTQRMPYPYNCTDLLNYINNYYPQELNGGQVKISYN